jgi:hypothetical protein
MLKRIFKRKVHKENHMTVAQLVPFEAKPYLRAEIDELIHKTTKNSFMEIYIRFYY